MSRTSDTRPALLATLEEKVRTHVDSFIEAGHALRQIRDERLFPDTYTNFPDYCTDVWDFSRQRAEQLITGAEIAATIVSRDLQPPPSREAHVRPLRRLPLDDVPKAWQLAVALAGDGRLKAQHVEEAVSEILGEEPPPNPIDQALSSFESATKKLKEAVGKAESKPPLADIDQQQRLLNALRTAFFAAEKAGISLSPGNSQSESKPEKLAITQ